MSVTTATAPELTSVQVAKILTLPLQQQSTFLSSGVKIYPSAGPLRLPKLGGPVADIGWTGEAEVIPTRDVEWDELSLLPSTMKSPKVITKYSNELARQSVVALDAAIKQRLVVDVANKLDQQFWSATGDGVTTPKGILAYSGTQSIAGSGALTLDVLLDAWGKALAANVNMAGLRWVMRPEQFTALRKVKATDGHYILNADPTADAVFRLFGSPVVVTNFLPLAGTTTKTQSVVLADMSQVAVAQDLAPSVTVLKELYAGTDEQGLRVVARYDAGSVNPEAIVKITGLAV